MAQEEEVPGVRILPPTRRPVLPTEEGYVPPVRKANAGKRSANPSHTIAVGSEVYALLLHEKHALEVIERRLVSFGEVIQGLIDRSQKLASIEERMAAKKAAREAAERGEG